MMHLIKHMFHTSVIPYISLDRYYLCRICVSFAVHYSKLWSFVCLTAIGIRVDCTFSRDKRLCDK